jgi:hypothetical protein
MKTDALLSSLLEGLDLSAIEGRLAALPVNPKTLAVYEASPNDWFLVDETGTSWGVIYDPALAALLAHALEDLSNLMENIRAIRKEMERERALEEFLECRPPAERGELFDVPLSERDVSDLAGTEEPETTFAPGDRFAGKQMPGEVREIVTVFPDSRRLQYRIIQGARAGRVRTCSMAWFRKWAGEKTGPGVPHSSS